MLRAAQVVLGALALAFVATQLAAVYTESVNGDELALAQRAERTIATGHLEGGGRPGLATIALLPFVDGCSATVPAIEAARLAWLAITFALVGGLFAFLRLAARRGPQPWLAAGLGTALLVLVPVVLQFSLHVRTDQPAIAAGLWGGVAVLASGFRRWPWALLAGALFGAGFLFTQKVIYIVALVGVVALGDLFVERSFAWRRELLRAAAVAIGAVAVVAAYYQIVPLFYAPRPPASADRVLDTFDWLRRALGYSTYRAMLPTLVPHVIGLVLLVTSTVIASRKRSEHVRPLLVALAVMAVGFVVGRFHRSAFPYFWMTLGLFFASAIALGWGGIRAVLPRAHGAIAAVLVGWCLYHAIPARAGHLADTQAIQEAALGFVDRNFERSQRGFHPEGALFCRRDPDPIPARFNDGLHAYFSGPRRAERIADFIRQHRTRPIAFVVETRRVLNYPREIAELWATHYVRYYGPVKIAGRMIAGRRGERLQVELIVPGAYRWLVRDTARGTISVGGAQLRPGDGLVLEAGTHEIALLDDVDGMLVLAVKDPPWLTRVPFFAQPGDLTFYERLERERPPPRYGP